MTKDYRLSAAAAVGAAIAALSMVVLAMRAGGRDDWEQVVWTVLFAAFFIGLAVYSTRQARSFRPARPEPRPRVSNTGWRVVAAVAGVLFVTGTLSAIWTIATGHVVAGLFALMLNALFWWWIGVGALRRAAG